MGPMRAGRRHGPRGGRRLRAGRAAPGLGRRPAGSGRRPAGRRAPAPALGPAHRIVHRLGLGPRPRGRARGAEPPAVRGGSPPRPHRDHQPRRIPPPRGLARSVRGDARRARALADVAGRGVLPRQGARAAGAASPPPGLGLQPRAERQGGAGRASRRPDHRLGRPALFRRAGRREPRAPRSLRPRLPDRGGVPEPARRPRLPPAGADRASLPRRAPRRPPALRSADRDGGPFRIPRRRPQSRRRAVHEALLPDRTVRRAVERAAAPALSRALPGPPGPPGRGAAHQSAVPGSRRADRGRGRRGVPAPSVRPARDLPAPPAVP